MAADPEIVRAIITAGALLGGGVMITVGLVEAAFFINIAFMALFVFVTPGL